MNFDYNIHLDNWSLFSNSKFTDEELWLCMWNCYTSQIIPENEFNKNLQTINCHLLLMLAKVLYSKSSWTKLFSLEWISVQHLNAAKNPVTTCVITSKNFNFNCSIKRVRFALTTRSYKMHTWTSNGISMSWQKSINVHELRWRKFNLNNNKRNLKMKTIFLPKITWTHKLWYLFQWNLIVPAAHWFD